jgi:hypothetical protein
MLSIGAVVIFNTFGFHKRRENFLFSEHLKPFQKRKHFIRNGLDRYNRTVSCQHPIYLCIKNPSWIFDA